MSDSGSDAGETHTKPRKNNKEESASEQDDSEHEEEEVEQNKKSAPKRSNEGGDNRRGGGNDFKSQKTVDKTLFVGNLSFDIDEEGLREFFANAGEIVNVRMGKDRDTGKFRGFAHVEFADETASSEAIKLNGEDLLGRAVKLDYAGGGGGGGGFRGGRGGRGGGGGFRGGRGGGGGGGFRGGRGGGGYGGGDRRGGYGNR